MKLATLRTSSPDGRLVVVSRDLSRYVAAAEAETMQQAVEQWRDVAPGLTQTYDRLNDGSVEGAAGFRAEDMAAPLPRAWQWLDGSAYPSHGMLMQKAFNMPPVEKKSPLMYQGMSHRFFGATEDIPLPSEADGIDLEGELGIITDEVPMSCSAADALGHILLLVQINDWSLRTIAPVEMKTGFGWVQAKPACSVAPVAITPDELGDAWRDGRVDARLRVDINGAWFGDVPTRGMAHGFDELIAHAAHSRELCAGTIIGSGTVSSPEYREVGSCCLAERRAIEMIEHGEPRSPFLRFGDSVEMRLELDGRGTPFGEIRQRVVQA